MIHESGTRINDDRYLLLAPKRGEARAAVVPTPLAIPGMVKLCFCTR